MNHSKGTALVVQKENKLDNQQNYGQPDAALLVKNEDNQWRMKLSELVLRRLISRL